MNSTFSEAACPKVFVYFLSSLSESDQSGPFSAVFTVMFSIPRGGLTKRRPLECVYGMNEWMNYRTIKELLTSSSLIFLTSIKKLSLRLVSWFPLYSFFYFIFFNFIVLVLPYINIRHRYTLRPMDRSTKQKINKETQTLNDACRLLTHHFAFIV